MPKEPLYGQIYACTSLASGLATLMASTFAGNANNRLLPDYPCQRKDTEMSWMAALLHNPFHPVKSSPLDGEHQRSPRQFRMPPQAKILPCLPSRCAPSMAHRHHEEATHEAPRAALGALGGVRWMGGDPVSGLDPLGPSTPKQQWRWLSATFFRALKSTYCGYKVICSNCARFRLHYYFLNLHLQYAVLGISIYFTFTFTSYR